MQASRPVIAFALLRQCSELMRTDLLTGVAVLIKPVVTDLADQVFDARVLCDRLANAYGISIPAAALEGMVQRLVNANVLRIEETETGLSKALYCRNDDAPILEPNAEKEIQQMLDDFLTHAKERLESAGKAMSDDALTTGFLHHLATLDFSAIKARPVLSSDQSNTIVGPATRELQQVSAELAEQATLDSLVASYVAWVREHNEPRLALLAKVADGALAAELVFDLQAPSAVTRMTNTTVVVDTPLILSFLDLSATQDTTDVRKLFEQVTETGAKIAAFQHSIEEAEGVLKAIQNARGAGDAYGPSVPRLSNANFRAYFESMMGSIAKSWLQAHHLEIIQESATHFHKNFTLIDEEELVSAIRFSAVDRVLTRERDAKSVAETMRRLGGAHVPKTSVSSCRFIFVTSNAALQRRVALFLERKGYVLENEFNPIVTSRYLSGLCWLMCGGKSDQSPTVARLLANCAAALRLKPELAERTKRFLAAIDPEKARHFEALMTNERASQYLAEITLGDWSVITANNVEDIFEEVQRRAAEKVAIEKDNEYQGQIAALQEQVRAGEDASDSLQRSLAETQLDLDARKMEFQALAARAAQLEEDRATSAQRQNEQKAEIDRLSGITTTASERAQQVQEQLAEQLRLGRLSASRYAHGRVKLWRWFGVIASFVLAVVTGYVDKFWIPSLPADTQQYGNIAVIAMQALLGLSGLSLLINPLMQPLMKLTKKLYLRRLLELGIPAESAADSIPQERAE